MTISSFSSFHSNYTIRCTGGMLWRRSLMSSGGWDLPWCQYRERRPHHSGSPHSATWGRGTVTDLQLSGNVHTYSAINVLWLQDYFPIDSTLVKYYNDFTMGLFACLAANLYPLNNCIFMVTYWVCVSREHFRENVYLFHSEGNTSVHTALVDSVLFRKTWRLFTTQTPLWPASVPGRRTWTHRVTRTLLTTM